MSENVALREATYKFLEYNQSDFLRLYGGFCDWADINDIYAASLKHLVLRDMNSVGLANVFANLPELSTFHVENVEAFDVDAFGKVFLKFQTYQGLEKLVLDLLVFDLEAQKEMLIGVLKHHSKSLRHLSLARNKISNAFLQFICEQLSADNRIEYVDLRYLKETKDTNWVTVFKSIALLTHSSKKNVTVCIAGY
jgi:hypothetical protein